MSHRVIPVLEALLLMLAGIMFDASTAITANAAPAPTAKTAAGGLHTCALTTGGAVRCWGSNAYGELGNGTLATAKTPVAVSGLTGVKQISAGKNYTCALLTAGT